MGKDSVAFTYNGILFRFSSKWNKIVAPHTLYTKWNKPDSHKQTLPDSTSKLI
jgi:hypothetical protein